MSKPKRYWAPSHFGEYVSTVRDAGGYRSVGCKVYTSPEKAMAACARKLTSRIAEHRRQVAKLQKLLAKSKAGKLRVSR